MAEQQELQIIIVAKDEATKVLSALSGSATKASGSLKGTATQADKGGLSIAKLAAAVGLGNLAYTAFHKAVSFAVDTLRNSITEFGVQEQAIARLRAGLKNTTPEWKKGTDELVRYAGQLQKVTTFGDEQIISAQGMLSTFMLNDKQIKQLTPSILDMAAALEKTGGSEADLQQISILLGKAIGGEDVAGLAGALRRVGVVMTEHQTEILKTGTMQERLGTITQIVAQNFGGFASETANTYTGKLRQMKNALSDVRENIGEQLMPIVASFATSLSNFVTSEGFTKWIKRVGEFLQMFAKDVQTIYIPLIRDELNGAFSTLSVTLGEFFGKTGVSALTADFSALDYAIAPIIGLVKVVNVAFTAANAIMLGLKKTVDALVDSYVKLFDSVGKAAKAVRSFLDDKVSGIKGGAEGLLNFLKTGNLEGRAAGGTVRAGQMYDVGEHGPERFLPDVSGRIVKNGDVSATTNLTVNVGSVRGQSDIDAIVDAVSRALNRRNDLAAKGAI